MGCEVWQEDTSQPMFSGPAACFNTLAMPPQTLVQFNHLTQHEVLKPPHRPYSEGLLHAEASCCWGRVGKLSWCTFWKSLTLAWKARGLGGSKGMYCCRPGGATDNAGITYKVTQMTWSRFFQKVHLL